MKRTNYIGWDSYFMSLAAIASFRSKDPSTQNGACIVDPSNNRVLSLGYNGFPLHCSDDEFPWTRNEKESHLCKYDYVIHAEMNAIFNSNVSLAGSTLYLYSEKGYLPCCRCAQAIVQNQVLKVILCTQITENTDKYNWLSTEKMFKAANVLISNLEGDEIVLKDMYNISSNFLDIAHKLEKKGEVNG